MTKPNLTQEFERKNSALYTSIKQQQIKRQVPRITMIYTLCRACQLAPDHKSILAVWITHYTASTKIGHQNVQLQYCTWQKENETLKKNQIHMHNKAQLFKALNLQSFGCWMEVIIHRCGPGRRRQGLNMVDLLRSSRRPRKVVDKPKVYLRNIHSNSSVALQSGKDHQWKTIIYNLLGCRTSVSPKQYWEHPLQKRD